MRHPRRLTARLWTAIAAVLALALSAWPASAPVAGAGPPPAASASASDTTPEPGQTITVSARGLLPGWEAWIDYFPDQKRLATVPIRPDGTFTTDVVIPADTLDGVKGIAVISIDAAGSYAYLTIELVVRGAPADVDVSATRLRPGESMRVTGTRFQAGSPVFGVLFPAQTVVFQTTATSDRRFAATIRLPDDLPAGEHGLAVSGIAASGGPAYFPILLEVVGGSTRLPPGDPFQSASTSTSTTTTRPDPSTTSTTASRTSADPSSDGDDGWWAPLAIVLAALVLLILLGRNWLRSPAGRRWRQRRRERRRRG